MADSPEVLTIRVRRVEERVDHLEGLEPAVVANELKNLSRRVDGMTKAFVGLMIGIVLSAATFAITAFSVWGHP